MKHSVKFYWKIKNFSQRPESKNGEFIDSEKFRVSGPHVGYTEWKLDLLLGFDKEHPSDLLIDLVNCSDVVAKVTCKVFIQGKEGSKKTVLHCPTPKVVYPGSLSEGRFEGQEEFSLTDENRELWTPSDEMTIVCRLSLVSTSFDFTPHHEKDIINDLKNSYAFGDPLGLDVTVKCGEKSFEGGQQVHAYNKI